MLTSRSMVNTSVWFLRSYTDVPRWTMSTEVYSPTGVSTFNVLVGRTTLLSVSFVNGYLCWVLKCHPSDCTSLFVSSNKASAETTETGRLLPVPILLTGLSPMMPSIVFMASSFEVSVVGMMSIIKVDESHQPKGNKARSRKTTK